MFAGFSFVNQNERTALVAVPAEFGSDAARVSDVCCAGNKCIPLLVHSSVYAAQMTETKGRTVFPHQPVLMW